MCEVSIESFESFESFDESVCPRRASAHRHLTIFLASLIRLFSVHCQVPFSGRRSSAQGTMSITEALRVMSIETVVAYPAAHADSRQVAMGLDTCTNFFAPLE